VVNLKEELLDAFTAVAASGPAYVYYLAELMVASAQELGVDAADADLIVRQTIRGAAALLDGSPESPAQLRAAVTSKGGTTEAAVRVLDGRGVPQAVLDALRAARDRGRDLGGGSQAATGGHPNRNT
jgi:pyrroline-5-carboxylate reductase